MRAIKLSEKAARAIHDHLNTLPWGDLKIDRANEELRRALQPRPKSSQVKKREARNRAKATQTRGIYGEVEKRADGKCECGCTRSLAFGGSELDHFFGRAKAKQSVANCWLLAKQCALDKTRNTPSAAYWFGRFISHATRYGYHDEAERARDRLSAVEMTRGTQ